MSDRFRRVGAAARVGMGRVGEEQGGWYGVNVLAIDLGATTGRALRGHFDGARLRTEEVHRFANDPVRVGERLYWDVLRLYHEVKLGLRAGRAGGEALESVGIDGWALDFGLIAKNGELLGNPVHYRDRRTEHAVAEIGEVVPPEDIFAQTGIQFMPINTLCQLWAMRRDGSPLLDRADALLMIPDLIRFFLSGERSTEATLASTTQFWGLRSAAWDRPLLRRLGLPDALLTPVVQPATAAGRLTSPVAAETGAGRVPVVVVAEHDTASAVAAVPAESGSNRFAFLSCGTWSLLGTELDAPIVDRRALEWNFSNEGGLGGTIRFLKNIMGLWLVDECRRAWARDGNVLSYEEMERQMAAATPFAAFVDPDAARFVTPSSMPNEIRAAAEAGGQRPPDTIGAILRCAHESLALTYRFVFDRLERLVGARFPGLHIVGGGARNRTLCRMTANALGRPVWAGPMEATATGNMLAQLMANGRLGSLADGRAVVRASVPIELFAPHAQHAWDDAFGRFVAVTGLGGQG